MELLMVWLVPVVALVWLAGELYMVRKRKPGYAIANAFCLAFVVWLMCMARVDWVSKIPIALWWAIPALAGLLVAAAIWPRRPHVRRAQHIPQAQPKN